VITLSTRLSGASPRQCPRCPGWPPGLRALFFLLLPRSRCSPASPSDEGGFDEVTEFCSRIASFRSRSEICFSASAICFSASRRRCSLPRNSSRNRSISRLRRSFSRSSFRHSGASGFTGGDERCRRFEALKHLHCQVLPQRSRSNSNISDVFR
jgi:hypothetical protein